MKIRTVEDLNDRIDSDFAWRRKELTIILSQVEKANGKIIETAIRSGLLILYAHWEGFVKNSAELYLNFVSNRKLKNSELSESFIALIFKKELDSCQLTNKNTVHTQVLNYILNSAEERSSMPYKGIIDTKSNLSSDVLKELLSIIGLDYLEYELKANLIDIKLLKNRNEIAHGQYLGVEQAEFRIIYNEIISLIIDIKNAICNAAIEGKYRRIR